MTDTLPEGTDDVNEVVEAEWSDETTPFDRVRTVMKRTYEPQSADEVADRARTTPTTARKHLRQLEESGFVEIVSRERREAALYQRSNESLVLEQAHDILDHVGREELVSRITEMNDKIHEYRAELSVESPEDAALMDADIDQSTLHDWETTRRNLGFAKVALALMEAETSVQTTSTA
jgi:predicted ArsR family transcriptional regulator